MNRRVVLSVFMAALTGLTTVTSTAQVATNASLGSVKGTILDAATGQPTACTVTLTGPDGHRVIERESFSGGFRCDGRFLKQLPAGRVQVRITRGFETRAVERVIDVPTGKTVELSVRLERLVDLRARHWYAGDSHVHMIHGEKTIPIDFDFVALTAQAEDLQYMSLAQDWALENPTPERLEAELGSRSRPDCLLRWNLEAPKNYFRGDAGRCLGHCWNVGVQGRTAEGADVVRTLLLASAHDYQSDKPTYANFESHRLIHAQGGAVFYTHPARWWTGSWGGQGGYPKREQMKISNMAVELPLDTVLGPTFDGVDVITGNGEFEANAMAFNLWSLLLNHGYRLAATASSDACFDRPGGGIPGVVRTYSYVPEGFSLTAVTRATAKGHTFATSGPLLLASLDDQPPGSEFAPDGKEHTLKIEGWPSGTDPKGLTRVEILRDGSVFQETKFAPAVAAFATNIVLKETQPGWYCVRLFGGDQQRQRAISGAFYFAGRDKDRPTPAAAHVRVIVQDAATQRPLLGAITEVEYQGTLPHTGPAHPITAGEAAVTVPGTMRLRAESPGYQPLTLSPVVDNPAIMDYITHLSAEDLLRWETFERVRSLLRNVTLKFDLKKLER